MEFLFHENDVAEMESLFLDNDQVSMDGVPFPRE
jgi:hypothetical protein